MKDELVFAQLSDPHLSTLEGVRWWQLGGKRLLGYLSWRRRRRLEHRREILDAMRRDLRRSPPDHLVITGDLTHIGLPDEFRQARHWLESLGEPRDVTVIPGNHDAYAALPWEQGLARWEPWMQSDALPSMPGAATGAGLFPSLRIRGPVAFIGLSSARPTAPLLATGRIGPAQLGRLLDLLEETGRQGLFRVVLLHHPPVPGTEKWRKRLTDAVQVCRTIARGGAELVLHGHRHRSVQSRIEIPGTHVPVFGIPSASAAGDRPGRGAQYYLYRVSRARAGWRLEVRVRTYTGEHSAFSGTQGQVLEIPARGRHDKAPG
jgi:3',5'-cyclic AMP phosphodiesterase CpdA